MTRSEGETARGPGQLGEKPELRWVKITQLYVDPAYQRSARSGASRKNLAHITAHFDWAHCGALIVCWMPDNQQYAVVDGQHRLLAALGRPDVPELPCVVLGGQDLRGQAESFVAVNTRRVKLNSLAAFHAAVAAGDADAASVKEIADACGLDIPRNPVMKHDTDPTQVQCVGTLVSLLGSYSRKQIVWALTLIPEAYADTRGQMRPGLIKALVEFIRLRPEAARGRMVEVLRGIDPDELEREARSYMAIQGGTSKGAMTAALDRHYSAVKRRQA